MEFDEYVVDLNADCKCGCMEGDRFHQIYHFPNDYGASVVNNSKLKGFNAEGYRILLIIFSGEEDYEGVVLIGFEQDELDYKSWGDAVRTLDMIKNLEDDRVQTRVPIHSHHGKIDRPRYNETGFRTYRTNHRSWQVSRMHGT